MSFKGAIFDLDGTILDSMPLWSNLCRAFSKNCGREFSLPLHTVLLFLFLIFKNVPGFTIEHLTDRR